MKKYFFILFSIISLPLAVQLVLFTTQLGIKTESIRWVREAFEIKEIRAQSIAQPKILIISGSNALFSLSAEEIEKQLEIPTVNAGIHAGLQAEYILDRTIKLVQNNDIVILPFEYEFYNYSGETNVTLADFVSSDDPTWILKRPLHFVKTAFHFSIKELIKRNLKRKTPDVQRLGYYDASHLSPHGDKTNTSRSLIDDVIHDRIKNERATEISFSKHSVASKVIANFITICREKDAQVILTFPVTINFPEYQNADFKDQISQISEHFSSKGANVLGTPTDFLLSEDFFLDTKYHASSEGREFATDKLTELLRDFLNTQ